MNDVPTISLRIQDYLAFDGNLRNFRWIVDNYINLPKHVFGCSFMKFTELPQCKPNLRFVTTPNYAEFILQAPSSFMSFKDVGWSVR